MRLSENIRSLRKERALTQEQLAQALGVTAGAVYKWEAKLSTPDLSLIVELADLFDTSVDVLLGYEMKNNRRDAAIARLKEFLRSKDARGLAEADKLLIRYPNCFEIVYQSAVLYRLFGFMRRDQALLRRSVELLERARLLIGQNTDPEISEFSINSSTAMAYAAMGEHEKAAELLIRENPRGVNDDLIGFLLGTACGRPDEAVPYLSTALLHSIESLTRIAIGYFHVYFQRGEFSAAADILCLALRFFSDLKRSGRSSSLDKTSAELHVYLAMARVELGDMDGARASLRMAKALAEAFDGTPDYDMARIRFVAAGRPLTAFDDMGDPATEGISGVIASCRSETLAELWKEISKENQQEPFSHGI